MEQTIICRPAKLEVSPATLISTVLPIYLRSRSCLSRNFSFEIFGKTGSVVLAQIPVSRLSVKNNLFFVLDH